MWSFFSKPVAFILLLGVSLCCHHKCVFFPFLFGPFIVALLFFAGFFVFVLCMVLPVLRFMYKHLVLEKKQSSWWSLYDPFPRCWPDLRILDAIVVDRTKANQNVRIGIFPSTNVVYSFVYWRVFCRSNQSCTGQGPSGLGFNPPTGYNLFFVFLETAMKRVCIR